MSTDRQTTLLEVVNVLGDIWSDLFEEAKAETDQEKKREKLLKLDGILTARRLIVNMM